MSKKLAAMTTHVTVFGNTNTGKSTLFNSIIGQDIAIVSNLAGTTTDPVSKRFELISYGPIILTDTAGLNDDSFLGNERIKKAQKMLARTDFGIVVVDASQDVFDLEIEKVLNKLKTPYLKVFNKIDKISVSKRQKLQEQYPDAYFISLVTNEMMLEFKEVLRKKLGIVKEKSLIADLFQPNSNIVLVVPIDSEAPKGRIILPQVQVIRDCLDHNVNAIVTNETNLASILQMIKVDLVITDSQAFHIVKEIVGDVALTSFSIIFARFKADLKVLVEGVKAISKLKSGSKILICESCSHNIGHEDIGYVKIPKLLKKRLGDVEIVHKMGNDFVEDIQEFDVVIHCGSCMLNEKVMKYRMQICAEHNVAITNYGIYLAYENGILDRAIQIFVDKEV